MRKGLRSTRFRVALTSFLASIIALGIVSAWLVLDAQHRLEDGAAQLARARAAAIVQLLNNGATPADLRMLVRDSIYEVTSQTGERLASCPDLRSGAIEPEWGDDVQILEPGDLDLSLQRSVGCAPVLGTDPGQHGLRLHVSRTVSGDSKYRVFGAAMVDESGQAALDVVRTTLLVGVPVIALLIGVMAWLAVRRSLRPVEAIRSEVAEIGAHDLSRRVPAPDSGDEIAKLAETMNTMLSRLDAAVTRQSRFTSDASHELRTPLASLRTQLEVLLAHPDRLDWHEACRNALLDVTRLQDLVADLVLLGKLDNSGPERFSPVRLSEVVESGLSGRQGVWVRVEGDPVVLGNRGRLERLLRNLVDNAQRHTRTGVEVAVSTVDDFCVLTVTDDGPGIPAGDRERVFDRFVRLDDGRARDEGGAGLGLAIVADIAHAHGGTAEVDGHDGGARLVVRLPSAETRS
ncbi:ATP-binding protein [Amycolatopsis regifaucium]|uniref:histidine kinase n=1 Tax=Amycolatopsis regifaucium TaxID=546365 RepID=A0A154MPD6_9PSEU|nr:ATP-binding protein [Amycolatopsis regifaucium]KZB86115.1 histidine kinase [Amycolatopsis regifaucium]OKA05008.1 two-component sensor histidine kinase [Amycolatopsis regifaucium]SFH78641.1 Signal transduction histidine kinase [Amycolatopsis regifaucium]